MNYIRLPEEVSVYKYYRGLEDGFACSLIFSLQGDPCIVFNSVGCNNCKSYLPYLNTGRGDEKTFIDNEKNIIVEDSDGNKSLYSKKRFEELYGKVVNALR